MCAISNSPKLGAMQRDGKAVSGFILLFIVEYSTVSKLSGRLDSTCGRSAVGSARVSWADERSLLICSSPSLKMDERVSPGNGLSESWLGCNEYVETILGNDRLSLGASCCSSGDAADWRDTPPGLVSASFSCLSASFSCLSAGEGGLPSPCPGSKNRMG